MSQRDQIRHGRNLRPVQIEPYEEESFPLEYRAPYGTGFVIALGSTIGVACAIYMLARVIFG